MNLRRVLLPVAALSLLASALPAATASPARPGFHLLDSATASLGYTGDADLENVGGKLSVLRYETELGGRSLLTSGAALLHGIAFSRTHLDRPDVSLLPESLQEVSLRLGWQYQRDPNWRFMVSVRPGFYGDGSSIESDTFNAPFLGLASYATSRELVWSFGLIASAFSDNPVLPVAGVRWQFAPAWTLNIGFPRAGVAWELDESTTLTFGATFQGGAYKVMNQPAGAPAGSPSLVGEELDYREIRVGLGGTFRLSAALALTADVGMTVDQRFDYHEFGLEHRGDEAFFAAIAISARF